MLKKYNVLFFVQNNMQFLTIFIIYICRRGRGREIHLYGFTSVKNKTFSIVTYMYKPTFNF